MRFVYESQSDRRDAVILYSSHYVYTHKHIILYIPAHTIPSMLLVFSIATHIFAEALVLHPFIDSFNVLHILIFITYTRFLARKLKNCDSAHHIHTQTERHVLNEETKRAEAVALCCRSINDVLPSSGSGFLCSNLFSIIVKWKSQNNHWH